MRIINSSKGRLEGVKNDLQSKYWEYTDYSDDGIVWQDTVLLEAFGGKNFQGNVFYIYRELFFDKTYKNFKFVISHQEPEKLTAYLKKRNLIDDRVEIMQTHSFRYRECLAHAKYLVNNVSFNMNYIKKTEQIYLNTWHGTPLKYLGRKIKNDAFECNNAQRNFLMADYIIAPNELTKKVFNEDYMIKDIIPGKIIDEGYPRNSIFFDDSHRKKIREKYGLEGKTAILYMPTWRGNTSQLDDFNPVNEIEQLAYRLGKSYIVYVKFHPAMIEDNTIFEYCRNVPEDLEVYEFLAAMDGLITDYSSVFFDFACTGKNIYLIQQDRDIYFKNRGVYNDVEKSIPFPIAFTFDELHQNITKLNSMEYSKFQDEYCKYDDLSATKKVINKVFKDVNSHYSDHEEPIDLYVIDFATTNEQLLTIISKIESVKYRLIFVPKRSNGYFRNISIFDQIYYMMCRPGDRLKLSEKVFVGTAKVMRLIFKSFNIERSIKKYAEREQKRLWGNIKIGDIYAKQTWLPTALCSSVKRWYL